MVVWADTHLFMTWKHTTRWNMLVVPVHCSIMTQHIANTNTYIQKPMCENIQLQSCVNSIAVIAPCTHWYIDSITENFLKFFSHLSCAAVSRNHTNAATQRYHHMETWQEVSVGSALTLLRCVARVTSSHIYSCDCSHMVSCVNRIHTHPIAQRTIALSSAHSEYLHTKPMPSLFIREQVNTFYLNFCLAHAKQESYSPMDTMRRELKPVWIEDPF